MLTSGEREKIDVCVRLAESNLITFLTELVFSELLDKMRNCL